MGLDGKEGAAGQVRVALGVGIVAAAVFANTLWNGFVWDDRPLISENPHLREPGGFSRVFRSDFSEWSGDPRRSGYYRPLITLSYMVDYRLWEDRAGGFHVTNVLFHALTSGLVWAVAYLVLRNRAGATAAGLLFATHPIHTEAVSWISGRTDIVCGLFFLLGFVVFLRSRGAEGRRRVWLHAGASAAFAAALLAKEMAVALPLVLILYEAVYRPPRRWREEVGRRWRLYLGLLAISGLYLALRIGALGGIGPQRAYAGGSWGTAAATAVKVLVLYLRLLVLPVGLSAELDIPIPRSPFETSALGAGLAVGATTAGAVWMRGISPGAAFGLLWILVTFLPVSNLIPFQKVAAERFLYIPSVGFCLATGAGFGALWMKASTRRVRIALGAGLGVILIGYSVAAVDRNRDWRDEWTIYARTVEASPRSPTAHYNFGTALLGQGDYDRAIEELKRAFALEPRYMEACYNLACAYARKGDVGGAVGWLTRAVERGMDRYEYITRDPDLEVLHSDPGYQRLMERLRHRKGG